MGSSVGTSRWAGPVASVPLQMPVINLQSSSLLWLLPAFSNDTTTSFSLPVQWPLFPLCRRTLTFNVRPVRPWHTFPNALSWDKMTKKLVVVWRNSRKKTHIFLHIPRKIVKTPSAITDSTPTQCWSILLYTILWTFIFHNLLENYIYTEYKYV